MRLLLILALLVTMTCYATVGTPIQFLMAGLHDSSGKILSAGTVECFYAGLTLHKNVYLDRELTTPASNPLTLGTDGTAMVYGSGLYKFVVSDKNGTVVHTYDNINIDFTQEQTGEIASLIVETNITCETLVATVEITAPTIEATTALVAPSITLPSFPTNSAEAATKGYVDAAAFTAGSSETMFSGLKYAVDNNPDYTHEATFPFSTYTDNIPSGMYFIHMQTNDSVNSVYQSAYFIMSIFVASSGGQYYISAAPAFNCGSVPTSAANVTGAVGFNSIYWGYSSSRFIQWSQQVPGGLGQVVIKVGTNAGTFKVIAYNAGCDCRVRFKKLFTDDSTY